jgi:hypothetical protein
MPRGTVSRSMGSPWHRDGRGIAREADVWGGREERREGEGTGWGEGEGVMEGVMRGRGRVWRGRETSSYCSKAAWATMP